MPINCAHTKDLAKGLCKLSGSPNNAREIARRIWLRPQGRADIWKLFQRCSESFANYGYHSDSITRLIELMDFIGQDLGSNALHMFGEHALPDAQRVEKFIDLAYEAKSTPGADKLLRALSGQLNVKGVDYTFHFAEECGRIGSAVKEYELGTDAFRGCDIWLENRIQLGSGEFLAGECKSGPAQLLDPDQGLKYLGELARRGESPRLFRFVHNTDVAANPAHVAGEAETFLNAIKAKCPPGPGYVRLASRQVVRDLETEVTGLAGWTADPIDVWAHGVASREASRAKAIARMQEWFFHQFPLAYPPPP